MAKAVRMSDIAKKFGVSTVTVSKALAGHKGVSEDMRRKIKALAEELGYVPPAANKQGGSRSYHFGVLVSEAYIEKYDTFYWELYQKISICAVKENCFVMLEVLSGEDELALTVPNLIRENKIDGLMILGGVRSAYLKMLKDTYMLPAVYMDFYDNQAREDSIISNSFYGMSTLTDYLFDMGHRKIAFVGTPLSTDSITDRYLGYLKSLMAHGQTSKTDWIIDDRDQNRYCYEQITLPADMPEAFVCNCDVTAGRVVKSLREAGYRVPEDVSVVGYDDYLHPGLCDVGITTYAVDMSTMAAEGMKTLLQKMKGSCRCGGIHVVEGCLVIKDSVARRK